MRSYATWRQSAHSGDSRSRAKAKRSKRSSLSIWRIHKPVKTTTTSPGRNAASALVQELETRTAYSGSASDRHPAGRHGPVVLPNATTIGTEQRPTFGWFGSTDSI